MKTAKIFLLLGPLIALSLVLPARSEFAAKEGAAKSTPGHQITPAQATWIKYSRQRLVYLDPGETCAFRLRDGTEKQIRLVSVREEKDPVIGLTRRAEVKVEIDGRAMELACAPYVMPTETAGLRIQADTTSAWLDMPKRAQFSLWDASDPIVDTNLFRFPLPDYRLFSHGVQAYNEPVHLGHKDGDPAGQRFYHNYGVDLAGYEGRQKVLSCIDGTVVQADSRDGNFAVRDDRGLILYFGHLDSILAGIKPGAAVQRGQWIGMLGRRGASGNFSHLHVTGKAGALPVAQKVKVIVREPSPPSAAH
jgi:murein DD-endopeptidase MepM/ murein hydrolase activator NlpD